MINLVPLCTGFITTKLFSQYQQVVGNQEQLINELNQAEVLEMASGKISDLHLMKALINSQANLNTYMPWLILLAQNVVCFLINMFAVSDWITYAAISLLSFVS